ILRLNAIKPATLTISYDASQLSAGKEPLIFHRTDGVWKAIGGTVHAQQQTISAAVVSLGQYTLGEMDKIEALDSANLKPDSLTCQPRVFSPKGNTFSTHTTISFTLDQPAQVTIKVYNVAGQLVEWIAQQRTFGSGKQAIRWNGRDSDGEIVASGLYIVTVTVGDQTQDKVVNVWNH
ncbi:MAG: FlgD immunoglobulin-like domain containing protein, partial [Candidatus Poribacteria bacterium]|nr:FlgD immunoglobulin-like domain containing protein [Candidatus Poribacteria bacterium]